MELKKAIILSGMFARCNLGQSPADDWIVKEAKASPPKSAHDSAMMFCEPFMENSEDAEMFTAEAKRWLLTLRPMTDEKAAETWPDLLGQYDRA